MTATAPIAESEMLARLLHRDANMLVLNKPAGIAVHVTGNDAIALEQSFHFLQFGLPRPPALAHRLDRDTSGCLVLGRHRQALITLGDLFKEQKVQKTYLAIVVGAPPEAEGVITRPILKSGKGSKWRLTLDDAGQPAETHYRVVKKISPPTEMQGHFDSPSRGELSLLELSPKTGRTHQLRLHCMGLGCPIVGDPFYGVAHGPYSAQAQPLMLHAWKISIPHKPTKPPITVEAPIPEGMAGMVALIENSKARLSS